MTGDRLMEMMELFNMNEVASVITVALEIIIGLVFNMFIVSVIVYDLYWQKIMSSSSKILVCLGVLNMTYNALIAAGIMDDCIQTSSTLDLSYLYIILLLYSISSCAWLTAGLGAFYFIKISQARLLSWVKFHLSSMVPWMLLVLLVVSFIISFFSSLLLLSPNTSSRNITESPPSVLKVLAGQRSGFMNAVLIVTSIPFMVILMSSICTVWTLNRHSQKMVRGVESEDSRRRRSYEGVVCRMMHFLIFYGVFYTLQLIVYFSIIAFLQSGFWEALMLMSSFTPVQSVLLVLGNPRLRGVCKMMLPSPAALSFSWGSN
ncbi:taste receptor type 2 member 4-like [Anomaloglossus baeobatrachus]|uniref:taste receptor type 2 member 4-like n=1 Tax=Anomaloglossus baeobatrachus TaxID=238106 RepID=UPI003F4F4768